MPQSSPSRYAYFAGRADTAAAMEGYLCVQSRPVRVSRCTLPPSRRACMRYPSYLISCSHSGPCGGASTSLQSCGLTQLGSPVGSPRGVLFVDFVITAAGSVDIYRGEPSREDRYATGELERLPAPLIGVLPDLPVTRDGAHETHSRQNPSTITGVVPCLTLPVTLRRPRRRPRAYLRSASRHWGWSSAISGRALSTRSRRSWVLPAALLTGR